MGGRAVFVAEETAERPVHARTFRGAARTIRRRATRRGACGRMTGSTMDSPRAVKRTGYDKSRRRRCHESHDSCGAHRVCSAAAIVSIGTRLPVTESSPCAGSVNQTRSRCVAEDQRWMCNSAASTRVTHVRFRHGSFRWSHAHARPGRWIACREALRRRLVDIGSRTLARWPTRGFIATTVSWTAVVDALVFHLYLAREFRVPLFHCPRPPLRIGGARSSRRVRSRRS